MEKFKPVSFNLSVEQIIKFAKLAEEKDFSSSKYLRRIIDKLPKPKKNKKK